MADWRGPVGRWFVISWSVGLVIVVWVSIIAYLMTGTVNSILFGAVVAAPGWTAMILLGYHSIRPVWSFVYTQFEEEQDVVIKRIEAALTDAEMQFTERETVRLRIARTTLEILNLRPMEIVVEKGRAKSKVYVGPEEEGHLADVQRLKRLVDEAMAAATLSR